MLIWHLKSLPIFLDTVESSMMSLDLNINTYLDGFVGLLFRDNNPHCNCNCLCWLKGFTFNPVRNES